MKIAPIMIIIAILLAGIVIAEDYEYTYEEGAFNSFEIVTINYLENHTLDIAYEEFLSGVSSLDFTNTTSQDLDITTSVPNSTSPGNYSRKVTLSNAADNYTDEITFLFEITGITATNSTNTTTNTTNSTNTTTNSTNTTITFEITNTNPANYEVYGAEDNLPTSVEVQFTGEIDYNKSKINLQHNGENKSWITLRTYPERFEFSLDQQPQGEYTGTWELVDTENNTIIQDYMFEIILEKPPKANIEYPAKGLYRNEELELRVKTNNSEYQVQYLIEDGYPSKSSSKWTSLEQEANTYTKTIDFSKSDIGAIYIKITDNVGNYRIQPTGIVSAPDFQVKISEKALTTKSDETRTFEVDVIKKMVDYNLLRCKLTDFIANENKAGETSFNIVNKANLVFGSKEASIIREYDETVTIGTQNTNRLELEISVPETVNDKTDYESTLTCILSK